MEDEMKASKIFQSREIRGRRAWRKGGERQSEIQR